MIDAKELNEGNFYNLLKKIEVYFNQEEVKKAWSRMEELSSWRRKKLLKRLLK